MSILRLISPQVTRCEDPSCVRRGAGSLDAAFDALYTDIGRPCILADRLIRASLLQILISFASRADWWSR